MQPLKNFFANAEAPFKAARGKRQRGTTLIMVLFTILFTSVVLNGLLGSLRIQVTEQATTQSYERANYLAGAAVHHACTFLQNDMTWRTGIPPTSFPPGATDNYSATLVDGTFGTIVITGIGTSGGVTRTLQVTIE